jgi:hypothetical protein
MCPRLSTLPTRSTDWIDGEIEGKVEILMDFGFLRCDSERAIRSAFYIVGRVVEHLLSGVISSQQSPEADRLSR